MNSKEKSPSMLAHRVASPALVSCCICSDSNEHYTIKNSGCQVFVPEMCTEYTELEQKFAPKHLSSIQLSESYRRIGYSSKADRVLDCGTFLEFAHSVEHDGALSVKGTLHNANFCKDKLCPMCSWRRSYKIFAQVSKIMSRIGSKYKFLMLTLTVPNCTSGALADTLNRLFKAWANLIRQKLFKSVVKGFFRALEITYNRQANTYHPHFHAVLAVPFDYAVWDGIYITHDMWLDMWRKAYGDESIISLDIRIAKGKCKETEDCVEALSSAVAEIAKYSVKSSDYLIQDDESLTDDIVKCLSSALHHRRLAHFGGIFAEIAKLLKVDVEDDDLVHLDDLIDSSIAFMIVRYRWSAGVYKMTGSYQLGTNAE